MKWILAITLLLLLVTGCLKEKITGASVNKVDAAAEVEASFRQMMDAAFHQDTAGYFRHVDMAHYAGLDDYGNLLASGMQLEAIFRKNTELIERYESFDFTRLSVRQLAPSVVQVLAEVKAEAKVKNGHVLPFAGGYSQIWQKREGQWRVVSSASTVRPVLKNLLKDVK